MGQRERDSLDDAVVVHCEEPDEPECEHAPERREEEESPGGYEHGGVGKDGNDEAERDLLFISTTRGKEQEATDLILRKILFEITES